MTKINQAKHDKLTVDRVRELFTYDPVVGTMTRKSTGHVLGKNSGRRLYTIIDGISYTLSRVIWLHYYGVWPNGIVDHDDLNENNNKIDNLRDATYAQNSQNRKSRSFNGGITYQGSCVKPWLVRITVQNVRTTVGRFSTKEEGLAAYKAAAEKHHGEFAGVR